jgi:hypothetical protein
MLLKSLKFTKVSNKEPTFFGRDFMSKKIFFSSMFRYLLLAFIFVSLIVSLTGCELPYITKSTTPTPTKTQVKTTSLPSSVPPSVTPKPVSTNTVTVTPTTIPQFNAKLSEINGEVQAKNPSESDFSKVVDNFVLELEGQVKTLDNSKARLDTSDGNIIRLGSQTVFKLESQEKNPDGLLTKLNISLGQIWIILNTGAIDVQTPSGVASVRGSYLSVRVDPKTNEVYITCLEGDCSLENKGGKVSLVSGQTAVITNTDTAPVTGRMTEEELKQWLEINPEATIVIPIYTQTVNALPTITQVPGGTIPTQKP